MEFIANFFVYIYSLSFHFAMAPSLSVDREQCHLSTLRHSCKFDYQQRVLKMFAGPGYLCSDDGVI